MNLEKSTLKYYLKILLLAIISCIMLLCFILTLSGCGARNTTEPEGSADINTNNYNNFIASSVKLIDDAPNNTNTLSFNFDINKSQYNYGDENNVSPYKSNIISTACTNLTTEINKSVSAGYMVSAVLFDINTQKIITYNSQVPYTCQSCIKGPYITSEIENDNSVYFNNKEAIERLVKVSSGEDYKNLREEYGDENFNNWCQQLGIDFLPKDYIYPRNATTKDFAKLWLKMNNFINQHDYNKDPLGEYVSLYENTKCSAISEQLGSKYKVYSKAGWEHGLDSIGDDANYTNEIPEAAYIDKNPLNDEVATNDAGIVYANCGPYILTVFTSYPGQPYNIKSIVGAFDDLHTAIFSS